MVSVPSGVWTRLEHAGIELFQETGATADITVTEDGEVVAGFPVKVRAARRTTVRRGSR